MRGANSTEIVTIRDCYSLFYLIFLSVPGTRRTLVSLSRSLAGEQSGAVGACWAHNPEVGRSKLLSAKTFSLIPHSPTTKHVQKHWDCILITKSQVNCFKFDMENCRFDIWQFFLVIVNENVFLRRVSRCIMQFGTDWLCMKTHTRLTTILRPGLGILLQWRNRLARRTYKQY